MAIVKPEDGGGLPAVVGEGATEDYDEVGEDVTTSASTGGAGGATQGGVGAEPPSDQDYDEVMLDKIRNKTIKGTKRPIKIELVGLKEQKKPSRQPRP